MALETFPVIVPHEGSTPQEVVPKVKRNSFGDGYSQRVSLGINTMPENWDIVLRLISPELKDTVVNFLKARGGVEAFYYTPVGETVPRIYTCPKWKPVPNLGNTWDVTFTLIEEFDL